MMARALDGVRERLFGSGDADPFGRTIRSPRRHRLAWAGAAGALAILPAIFLGIGRGVPAGPDADPLTTQSIAAPASATGAAPASTTAAATPAQPVEVDRIGALAMIRHVLIAVQQANDTGNYTVLRDLGSPAFQAANTASRLSEIFAGLRARSLDLTAAAAVEPQLTTQPELNGDGMMRMAGLIPASPAPISFDLAFAAVEGRWMPFSISIALAPGAPAPAAALPGPDKRAEPAAQPNRPAQPAGSKQRAMAQPLEATRTQ